MTGRLVLPPDYGGGINKLDIRAMRLHAETPPIEAAAIPHRGEWHDFTRHAEFNAYLEDQDITDPEGWDRMTIAQKKAWLDGHG